MHYLERFLNNIVCSIILLGMMLLVTSDVTCRYVFNSPIQGTMEVTEFMMVGLFYLSVAHTQALKAHVRIDILITHFPPKVRLVLEVLVYLLGLVLFALIVWQSSLSAVHDLRVGEVTMGLIPFPIFPSKVLVPIGSFILCVRFMVDIFNSSRKLLKREGL